MSKCKDKKSKLQFKMQEYFIFSLSESTPKSIFEFFPVILHFHFYFGMKIRFHVIARSASDEAISRRGKRDCFASLAMTARVGNFHDWLCPLVHESFISFRSSKSYCIAKIPNLKLQILNKF